MKFIIALFVLALTCGLLRAQSNKPVSVVFVCEHGAARSLMAAKYLEEYAKERNVKVIVDFLGISPDSSINPIAKKNLTAEGFPITSERPHQVQKRSLKQADYVVTLNCTLPSDLTDGKQHVVQYKGIPSVNDNYQATSDSIKQIIKSLYIKIYGNDK